MAANAKDDYPEQFYTVPRIHGHKDAEVFKLKILTAIANELHGVRMAIEKVHQLKGETISNT